MIFLFLKIKNLEYKTDSNNVTENIKKKINKITYLFKQ